jgi:hypothetical protein
MTVRFERSFFGADSLVTTIGRGAIGGKAQGLVTVASALHEALPPERFPGVAVGIPRFTVLTTELFDAFMDRNKLWELPWSALRDDRIAAAFLRGELPPCWLGDLRAISKEVKVPLAVRSSSLLEDALYRPFAGVYGTKMIPNHEPSPDARFEKLVQAVKLIWASTFFTDARRYRASVGAPDRDEKMAVMIQEIVGQRRYERFYPSLSGVARSWNYYALGRGNPHDGVVDLALGLGKSIVEGGQVWSYSPARPMAPPPYNGLNDMLRNTQTRFWAVRMTRPESHDPTREDEYLVRGDLNQAEYDDMIRFVASTVDPRSSRVVTGTGVAGPRLVDFAPLLRWEEIPLNAVIRDLLEVCEDKLGTAVEIELAGNLDRQRGTPAQIGLVQVRPMVVSGEGVEVPEALLSDERAIVASDNVLGHGRRTDIADIVFVRLASFAREHTHRIARELELVNDALVRAGRPYLLLGFGRWGTSDPWAGIPVTWGQIGGARVIIEAPLEGVEPEPSQGSHFFHNVTSFQVSYFTMRNRAPCRIEWSWLDGQSPVLRGEFVSHLRLPDPLEIRVDGNTGRGVVLRHDG